ncbi:membrane steroid-binding protein 2-like [Miscanthus floridulus]|uniref:membrane steroid-binding protein 2-like n=1 Tax=Miscanthus floridulus TaxID=154761 RepID=UPI00345B2AF0
MASCSSVLAAPSLSASAPSSRRRASTVVCLQGGRRGRVASCGVRCSAGGQGGVKVPAKLSELWAAAKGAPPLAVLAGVAAAAVIYKVGSSLLAPRHPAPRRLETQTAPPPPVPEPVQVGEITEEELLQYDGSDPDKPLLMAIKGQIYDVSQSRMFYGPGGAYALFAGKDASRALAKMSFEPQDLNGDISGLTPMELGSLNDWEYKFTSKYVKVGTIRRAAPAEEVYGSISPEIREEVTVPVVEAEPEPEPEPHDDDTP